MVTNRYNSAMVMVHFARGQQKTPHMVLYQFFVAFGVVLGPALASTSLLLFPSSQTKDALANCVMVLWGGVLWALVLIFIPNDISKLEAQAGIQDEPLVQEEVDGLPERPNGNKGLALFLTLITSATIRMGQRNLGGIRELFATLHLPVLVAWS